MGRILSVDPGEKNIGLAISDPLGITARSLGVIRHVGRDQDVQKIVSIALENDAETILIGQAVGQNGEIGSSARHAQNLADAVRQNFRGEVILWDESKHECGARSLYHNECSQIKASRTSGCPGSCLYPSGLFRLARISKAI